MTNEYVYSEGRNVPVEVLADGNGTVAREGQGVALVGENADAVTVELVESESDRAVGILTEDPRDFQTDETASQSDYAAGDSAGIASAAILAPIVWLDAADAYAATVGDYVKMVDGGEVDAFTGPTAVQAASDNGLGITSAGQIVHDGTTDAADIDLDFTQDAFPFGMVFTTIAREWGVGERVGVIKEVL